MTRNWPWTFNSDKYSAGTKDLPLRLKYWSILLCDHWVSRPLKGHPEIENALNDTNLNLNTIQSKVLYIHLILTPQVQNGFQDTSRRKSEIGTLNTNHWGPNFGTTSRFRDTMSKNGNALNDPNWTWTLNSQRYYIYTKNLPLSFKFWSFLLYDLRFSRYKVGKNR